VQAQNAVLGHLWRFVRGLIPKAKASIVRTDFEAIKAMIFHKYGLSIFKQEKELGSHCVPNSVHIARQRRSFQGISGFSDKKFIGVTDQQVCLIVGSQNGNMAVFRAISWGHD